MKFKLARAPITEDLELILKRELRRQKETLDRLTVKQMKELHEICSAIEKKGLPSFLVCAPLPHGLGSGIFLHPEAEALVKGQIIGAYAGAVSLVPPSGDGGLYAFTPLEKIELTEEEQAIYHKRARFDKTRPYIYKVDAFRKGNFTRFVNHSEKPNLLAHLYRIPKNSLGLKPSPIEVIYSVKKKIRPGEQLLVSYEGEKNCYWDPSEAKPFPILPNTFVLDKSLKVVQKILDLF